MEKITKILVIGPGTMGVQIALQCALHNCQVKIYGRNSDALDRGYLRLEKLANLLLRRKYLTKEQVSESFSRIKMTSDKFLASDDVHLVTESIPEKVELKRAIWAEFRNYLSNEAILTTNSSTILPSELSEFSGNPENFLAWHFHLYCLINNIVDIMPHAKTKTKIIDELSKFSIKINQTPIILQKEQKGYVFNTMLLGFLSEAIQLAMNNVASIKDIDRAWIKIMNTPIGPFGIINSIGFDNVFNIIEAAREKDPCNESYKLALNWLKSEFNKSPIRKKISIFNQSKGPQLIAQVSHS
jgi:3-hydroxybutyryl-CoA dehydrogenase